MDIRSIIDSEDTPPTRKPSVPPLVKQEYRRNHGGFSNAQASTYDNRREIRPPQPSPLKTPSFGDSQFSSATPHDSIRSPYQRTPSIGLNNNRYPPVQAPGQSPHYGHQVLQYSQRESNSASGPLSGHSFGHSTPLTQTPTASTPGSASAHSSFPRPTSSHSIPTPNSLQHASSFLRESPQPSIPQPRTLSQPQGIQSHASQPGTPLGPPSAHARPILNYQRSSSGTYNQQRSPSAGQAIQYESVAASTTTTGSPSACRERQYSAHSNGGSRERELSLSVSPKTRLPKLSSISQMNSIEFRSDTAMERNEKIIPAEPHDEQDNPSSSSIRELKLSRTPSRSVGLSGLLNAEPSSETPVREYCPPSKDAFSTPGQVGGVQYINHHPSNQQSQVQTSTPPNSFSQKSPDASTNGHPTADIAKSNPAPPNSAPDLQPAPEKISSFRMEALKTSKNLIETPLPKLNKSSRVPKTAKRPIQELSEADPVEKSSVLVPQPAKKKARLETQISSELPSNEIAQTQPEKYRPPRIAHWQDVPIFAQSVRGPHRTMELFQQNLRAGSGDPPNIKPASSIPLITPLSQTNGKSKGPSHVPAWSSPANGVTKRNVQVPFTSDGPLGPREPTFNDTIPADELTRVLADFIFPNVVLNNEIGIAPAGGGRGLGAVLEVEARIGRLIDRNTNDRLRLPVVNECVISQADPNMRIAFESSMTEHQHRNLNQFLNQALVESQGAKVSSAAPRRSRIPMTYKHTHEIDTTYELSQKGALQLPHSVANGLNLRPNAKNKARVRVTTDEKTGDVLAKIVKSKIADIHVYSPRTLFDWRISVNAEMDFDIDMKDLVAIETRDGNGVRRKDRVSYKHLEYQIDLTQVTPAEPVTKMDKVHELEVEVSSEEIRKQGLLVMNNEPNGYEDLIKGFVDNVRLLARFCKD